MLKTTLSSIKFLSLLAILIPFSAYAAPGVSVYATGIYTDSTVGIYLYADTIDCNLVGYGVKLQYNPTDLTVNAAEKNENAWYFGEDGNKSPYMSPDTTTVGEVVFIGGKLDINDPTAGVTGNGILLGHVSFQKNNFNTPAFSLSYGRDGAYKNFVTTDNIILDDQTNAVIFDPVISMLRGEHSADTNRVVFFGCYNNTNGVLENRDCGGDWDFGGTGQIVGGNGNNIIVYQYDTAGDYTANLTMADSVRSLDITAETVETPLPAIDFVSVVDNATVNLTVTDLDPNDASLNYTVYWGDRTRSIGGVSFVHTYSRTGTDYHIRVKGVSSDAGEEFNYTFTYDEDLNVSIPQLVWGSVTLLERKVVQKKDQI